ncbi:DUF4350 domain-containing protein [Archaeoglobales archaeon]|nr:MAG: DUF4350 domain-containing protein [Archaeoglobales archaeon]
MRAILYGFLIFIGIIFLVLPLAVPVIKTSTEFSMFNTKWNGCSEFAKLLAERGKVIPIMYPYNSVELSKLDGVLIVVGPDIDFSSLEAEEVKEFLENGGTLFIADDFGTANSLLEKLGVKARFSTQPLKDIFYSKRAEFPVVVRIEDPELAVGVEKITLNVPSAIVGGGGEIFSSKVSVVGKNMRSYPIMAEIKYGKGRIIMLSDPSILINDMLKENRQFIENLVGYLGNTFYFDEAHHSDFNPYSVTTVYIHRQLDREKAFQVFVAVAALAIFIESRIAGKIARAITKILPKKEENIFEELPDWVDIRILEKIVNEIKTGSKLGDRYGRKEVYGGAEERS